MYTKKEDTMFATGEINGEPIIAFESDFDYPTNVKGKSFRLQTFKNELTGKTLYLYKDNLCTLNELIIKYLVDFYKIKD